MTTLVLLLLSQMDIVRPSVEALELAEKGMRQQVAEQEREFAQRERVRKQEFERRFNRLIEAVEQFSSAYNRERGAAWPEREAKQLRQAMKRLAEVEPQLKAAR